MRVLEGPDALIANHVAMDMTSFFQEMLERKLERTLKKWRIDFKDMIFLWRILQRQGGRALTEIVCIHRKNDK